MGYFSSGGIHGGPVRLRISEYYHFGGQRVALRRHSVLYCLAGGPCAFWRTPGTTSVVLNAGGSLHSEARHYPYGEERWSSGTVPTDYRFTGQRFDLPLHTLLTRCPARDSRQKPAATGRI